MKRHDDGGHQNHRIRIVLLQGSDVGDEPILLLQHSLMVQAVRILLKNMKAMMKRTTMKSIRIIASVSWKGGGGGGGGGEGGKCAPGNSAASAV